MTETKDKVITLESLALIHAYNQNTYMPKTDNVLTLIDLNDASQEYNPNDFIGFVLEITDTENETKQRTFTNKTSNNDTFDVKFHASQFDDNGDMLLYELYFYLENDKYSTISTVTKYDMLAGEKHSSLFSYSKLFGIKIV